MIPFAERKFSIVVVLGLLILPGAARGQGWPSDELPTLLDEDHEVALALSGAPAHISRDATVLVLKRGGFVTAREGTNGFTCLVDRYWVEALEPMCLNAEGSETILQALLLRNELRERGHTLEEVDREIEARYESGELRMPEGFAISYMFSSAQDLYTDSGQHLGRWVPHVMVYIPYLTRADIGGSPSRRGDPLVFRAGQRDAALIVPVADFVDPAG